MQGHRLAVGFVTHGESTAKYLPYFLESLMAQTLKGFKVLAVDNTEAQDNENSRFIRSSFPEIGLEWAGSNTGFSKAFNVMINRAASMGAEYFLALNPDMVLADDMAERLLGAIEKDARAGAATPKILKWDFANRRLTRVIDCCGLRVTKEHRFSGSGDGLPDARPDSEREVFGFTGAAVLMRMDALRDVAYTAESGRKEFFDELMFMYQEDCDLSYRLRLAGWKIVLVPGAIAYHDRRASPVRRSAIGMALGRLTKGRLHKKWSYRNQWIVLMKMKGLRFSSGVRYRTAYYQIKGLAFVLVFEQYLVKELLGVWSSRDEIRKRREQLKVRVAIEEIERWME